MRMETYKCQICGVAYKEKSWAEKCQNWCSKHSSCNLEITKHAVHSGGILREISGEIDSMKPRNLYLLLAGALAVMLVQFLASFPATGFAPFSSGTDNGTVNIDEARLLQAVIPEEGIRLKTNWQGVPAKMVEMRLLDIEKLKEYSARYGQSVTEEDLKIFQPDYNEPIYMNRQNSILIYNVLWALAYANKNEVLDYELGRYGWETVTKGLAGSYFSFADLGATSKQPQSGFNYFGFVKTSPEQQAIVNKIASEGAVPSCGNTFNLPDCSCSFAALALTELAASQGFSEGEIYKDLKAILPYRFPAIYIRHAIYFKLAEGLDWKDVDAKRVMNKEFSSAQGVARTHRALAQIIQKTSEVIK